MTRLAKLPILLVVGVLPAAAQVQTLCYETQAPQVRFAAAEIRTAAAARGERMSEAQPGAPGCTITVTAGGDTASQAYRIARRGAAVVVEGGGPAGAMYGGLDVAEAIRLGTLATPPAASHDAHIARRGIKFNIPLDARTPSYSDNSDSAQQNIAEMWSLEFWGAMLDSMARHRYNVLTLWSLHPFPSLVKVPEYPKVALADVMRTTLPDALFERTLAVRFPEVPAAGLDAARRRASQIIPQITRFFWGNIDLRWFPEACLSHPRYRGWYTVRHFLEGSTMPGSGILDIRTWRARLAAGQPTPELTPLQVADALARACRVHPRAAARAPRQARVEQRAAAHAGRPGGDVPPGQLLCRQDPRRRGARAIRPVRRGGGPAPLDRTPGGRAGALEALRRGVLGAIQAAVAQPRGVRGHPRLHRECGSRHRNRPGLETRDGATRGPSGQLGRPPLPPLSPPRA